MPLPQTMLFCLRIAQEARGAALLREPVSPLTPRWCQQRRLKASPALRKSRELCLMGQRGLILPVQTVWIKGAPWHPAAALPSLPGRAAAFLRQARVALLTYSVKARPYVWSALSLAKHMLCLC